MLRRLVNWFPNLDCTVQFRVKGSPLTPLILDLDSESVWMGFNWLALHLRPPETETKSKRKVVIWNQFDSEVKRTVSSRGLICLNLNLDPLANFQTLETVAIHNSVEENLFENSAVAVNLYYMQCWQANVFILHFHQKKYNMYNIWINNVGMYQYPVTSLETEYT